MSVPFDAAMFMTDGIRVLRQPANAVVDERGQPVGWVVRASCLGRVEVGRETPGAGPLVSKAYIQPGTDVTAGDRLECDTLPGRTFDVTAVHPRRVPGASTDLFLTLEIS